MRMRTPQSLRAWLYVPAGTPAVVLYKWWAVGYFQASVRGSSDTRTTAVGRGP